MHLCTELSGIQSRFEFRGDIAHPVSADIYGERNFTNTNDINFNSIFIEPGIMHLSVEKDKFKYLSLKGLKLLKAN